MYNRIAKSELSFIEEEINISEEGDNKIEIL